MSKVREIQSTQPDQAWQDLCPQADEVLQNFAAKRDARVGLWIPTMPSRLVAWNNDGLNYSIGALKRYGEPLLHMYGAIWKMDEDDDFLKRDTVQLGPLELKGPVGVDHLVSALSYIDHRLGENIFNQTLPDVHIINSRLRKKDLPALKS